MGERPLISSFDTQEPCFFLFALGGVLINGFATAGKRKRCLFKAVTADDLKDARSIGKSRGLSPGNIFWAGGGRRWSRCYWLGLRRRGLRRRGRMGKTRLLGLVQHGFLGNLRFRGHCRRRLLRRWNRRKS